MRLNEGGAKAPPFFMAQSLLAEASSADPAQTIR
jgi:hypothetical protein